ncbi:MAG: hypothetical protein ABL872_12910 [Lacibacter sp.]
MIKKKSLNLCLALLLFISSSAFAQQFRFKADLDSMNKSGFYTIWLSPEITAHLKTDFSDLRIADETGKWIPHIIRNGLGTVTKEQIIDFPIISNRIIDSGRTELILKNASDSFVNKIRLFLKNIEVNRTGVISGSNDKKNWFIISPVFISRSYETTATEYIQELNFTPSDYRYFKLIINNLGNDPVNILKAGIYNKDYFEPPPVFANHTNTILNRKEDGNRTIVTITEPVSRHAGQLYLKISAPKYYSREIGIYLPDEKNNPGRLIAGYELTNSPFFFEFPTVKTKNLLLVIHNKDNPPLTIDTIIIAEPNVFATAYLEGNHQYHLLIGNDSVMQPDFDLIRFKDSIPANSLFLYPNKIIPVQQAEKSKQSFFREWFIWPVFLLVLLLLFALVKGLLKDVKKSKP